MAKRTFEILDEMNQEDTEKGTQMVVVSPYFVSAQTAKGGAHVTMGVDSKILMDLTTEKRIAILVLVDKEEYFKR